MVKKRIIAYGMMGIMGLALSAWLSGVLDQILSGGSLTDIRLSVADNMLHLFSRPAQGVICGFMMSAWLLMMWVTAHPQIASESDTMKVTDKIRIPAPYGQGQHGNARFATEAEKEQAYCLIAYDTRKDEIPEDAAGENLGLVLGMEKKGRHENIFAIKDDEHAILIGATRSGKTRTALLETIWLRGKIKGSMVIPDPKGELYIYSHKYLEGQGMDVYALDFRQPAKSIHFNYMAEINKAADAGDIPAAIDYTWDIVSTMVGEAKGEPLWTNGEASVIAASILVVAIDAPPEYRNLTNVYYFLAYMCRADEFGEMPVNEYFSRLPDEHPAKGVFAVAEISPDKMRGSFFGSALATLRLFTNWNIAEITSRSDIELADIGRKPTAFFIIFPDEKKTLYPLISLLTNIVYVSQVKVANHYGGRVPRPVDFILEEFGQYPVIPALGNMLSMAAGRGLRFVLVLQDYQQLDKYKEDCETVKGNCQTTLYLRTPSQKTLEEISKRLDTYTVKTCSGNSSISEHGGKNISYSSGSNQQSRALLTPGEVGRIDRPYSLVLRTGDYPGIYIAPDLSAYKANSDMGLGDREHNRKIMMQREAERGAHEIAGLNLWGVWREYGRGKADSMDGGAPDDMDGAVSFLD